MGGKFYLSKYLYIKPLKQLPFLRIVFLIELGNIPISLAASEAFANILNISPSLLNSPTQLKFQTLVSVEAFIIFS